MSGAVLQVLPKRTFDFNGVILYATEYWLIQERIDISQYVDATLVVRIHSADSTGGQIIIGMVGDGFTEDDPDLYFFTPTLAAPIQLIIPGPGPALVAGKGTLRGQYAALGIAGTRTNGKADTG